MSVFPRPQRYRRLTPFDVGSCLFEDLTGMYVELLYINIHISTMDSLNAAICCMEHGAQGLVVLRGVVQVYLRHGDQCGWHRLPLIIGHLNANQPSRVLDCLHRITGPLFSGSGLDIFSKDVLCAY